MMKDWFKAEEQTVETFNKVFNLSQLRNINSKAEVRLGDILIGERREVFVDGKTLLMRLEADTLQNRWLEDFQLDETEETVEIPDDLTLIERNVLNLIKSERKIQGLRKIVQTLDLGVRTVDRAISSLKQKELIETLPSGTPKGKIYIMKRLEPKEITNVSNTYKLSPAYFKVYTFIKEYEIVERSEIIADNTDLNLKTVTNALMLLEDMGLIKKVQNGRSKMIQFVEQQ